MKKTRPAVFLDRDDTIIRNVPYLNDPRGVELLPLAVEGLRELAKLGYLLLLTSNQSGIGRGLITPEQYRMVHATLTEKLLKHGIVLDASYHCPHDPTQEKCQCRKPEIGMIQQACHDFDLDLTNSLVIGDSECDILMGKNAGIKTILIRNPGKNVLEPPDYTADNLLDAANWLKKNNMLHS